jgi:cytochrome c
MKNDASNGGLSGTDRPSRRCATTGRRTNRLKQELDSLFSNLSKRRIAMNRNFTKNLTMAAMAATAAIAYSGAWAQEHATAKQAEAMVQKGVAFIKANGKDKGYAEITSKQSQFKDRDLYLVVYGLDGMVWAHGANEKMVGKMLIDLKDVDGKEFVRERVELGKTKPNFWQDYKFTNPVSKKIEHKSMYCERLDDTVVCGGVYKS